MNQAYGRAERASPIKKCRRSVAVVSVSTPWIYIEAVCQLLWNVNFDVFHKEPFTTHLGVDAQAWCSSNEYFRTRQHRQE